MACIITHTELSDVYTQGMMVQNLIEKPELNGGLFCCEFPVLNELKAITKMLLGNSDCAFKSRSFDKRMAMLSLIVKESSHPSSSEILMLLEKINKLAKFYLHDENQAKQKNVMFDITIAIHLVKTDLESINLPAKFQPTKRIKKDTDMLIEKIWASAATLSTPSDHHLKLNSFNCRMALLVVVLEQVPECIPWTTLEQLSLMQTLVMKIIKNHENSSCPLISKVTSQSLHSSGTKRKESPVQAEPLDLFSQLNMRSSSSKSKASSSKDPTWTLNAPVTIYSSNNVIVGNQLQLTLENGTFSMKVSDDDPSKKRVSAPRAKKLTPSTRCKIDLSKSVVLHAAADKSGFSHAKKGSAFSSFKNSSKTGDLVLSESEPATIQVIPPKSQVLPTLPSPKPLILPLRKDSPTLPSPKPLILPQRKDSPTLPSPKPLILPQRYDSPKPKTPTWSQTGASVVENVFENTKVFSLLTGKELPKLSFTEIFDREVGGQFS